MSVVCVAEVIKHFKPELDIDQLEGIELPKNVLSFLKLARILNGEIGSIYVGGSEPTFLSAVTRMGRARPVDRFLIVLDNKSYSLVSVKRKWSGTWSGMGLTKWEFIATWEELAIKVKECSGRDSACYLGMVLSKRS